MRVASRFTMLGVALIVLACSSGAASGNAPKPSSRNQITADDLADATDNNVYDVVQRMRPQWLRRHVGPTASETPAVFIDNLPSGDVDRLRSISVANVQEIRYFTPSEATMKWGGGYRAGVIQVIRHQ